MTDRRQASRPLGVLLDEAFRAGLRWASLREKDLSPAELVPLARDLAMIARRYGARFSLHGAPEIAAEAGLDAVHLPAGGDARAARERLGSRGLIGISVHTEEDVRRLDPASADYVIAGPAFPTASKPGYGPALGSAGIAVISARSPVPVIAIGGVTTVSMPELIGAGAAGVAVMGSVMRAPDPGTETAALLSAFGGERPVAPTTRTGSRARQLFRP